MEYNISNNLTADETALIAHYHGVSKAMRLYVTPVIIFGGTLGNLLTIIVVLSHHFRYSPSSVPLITLAFVDIGVVYCNLLDVWLGTLLEADSLQYVRDMNPIGCKFSTFMTVFLTHCSSWVLVVINIERVASVFRPLKARAWCSKRRLGFALGITMAALGLISLHLFWTTSYYPEVEFDKCQYDNDLLGDHGHMAWLTIDACLFTFIPFVVILCCNVAIIYSLIQAKRRRIKHYHVRANHPSDSTRSITTMLVTISIVFLLTTSPLTMCYQFYDQLMEKFAQDPVGKAFWFDLVINTALVLLCYSNNAVNFLLYCISGSKFRFALRSVCSGQSNKRLYYSNTCTSLRNATMRSSIEDLGHSVNGFNSCVDSPMIRLSNTSPILLLMSSSRNHEKWTRSAILKKKTTIM